MKSIFKKSFVTSCLLAVMSLGLTQCGSTATDTDTALATDTTESDATAVAESSVNLATQMVSGVISPSVSSALTMSSFSKRLNHSIYTTTSDTIDCGDGTTGSGTLTFSIDDETGDFSFTATDCDFGDGSGVINGTFTLTITDTTVTMTFDSFSVVTDASTYTLSGNMIMTIDDTTGDVTIEYDAFSATDSSDSSYAFTLSGTLTYSSNGTADDTTDDTLTGSLTVTDGTITMTCSFGDFDTTTSSWTTTCTED